MCCDALRDLEGCEGLAVERSCLWGFFAPVPRRGEQSDPVVHQPPLGTKPTYITLF